MSANNRYQRQIQLSEIGIDGQIKLTNASVLVIGAGGLGCPALLYLAGAGVGRLGIVDFDSVSLTNLHRQPLYTTSDVGQLKAEVAASKLQAINPEIKIDTYTVQLSNQNAIDILSDYDLIIDGTDNFSTRYLVNDACVLLDKPLIYGAVMRFEGQVGVFNLIDKSNGLKTNYRDLFPKPPDAGIANSCNEVGVLGVLPGIIGSWQASEAIKIITDIGIPLLNKILTINLLYNTVYEFQLTKSQINDVPTDVRSFLDFNYHWFCGEYPTNIISFEDFNRLRQEETCTIIDVREHDETPIITEFETKKIPMSILKECMSEIYPAKNFIFICQTGQRSLKASGMFKRQFPTSTVFSLEGGIVRYKNKIPTL